MSPDTLLNLPANISRLRVLIVEDDPMMQLGLEQSLMAHPQLEIVGQAEDGYLGVQAALKLKPDIVVMDIGLPRLDGIAATQQIKTALPDTHVVMLTSHKTDTEIFAALSSGADAFCIKGASIERLLNAISAAVEGATYLDPQIARRVIDNLKPPSPTKNENAANLSSRELEVLKLMVEGFSNPEIAQKLYLSPNTIKTHVRGIMNKLSVDDRVQAAVVALRSGLV
ncbi:response regulator transcription factor [Aetokthonos hydrillicola Thurmond2011]|jgi:DNA-binding NarL/FixJ family response regulator|uniref:Response regulator transcription factor n=1 Tax=Aetokthonos hydrillicola Thurmond2011 TaxID=2712845 RepID=A0AAP5M8R6_9CYAN|nr:response regulator transcription factor [Aetokthonos hydrillicola]MBO3459515.1 response regulator transcription factor [Aetokthonos hydrillicola CCALA 1050]MBW4591060.1 response regulator transcription factor [Aetokthonos hydrillicola CCALA 1050]MDR9899451.1 response regulator transcription factor [Aetokthonos hydrillicola Thurmond2011]